MCGFRNRVFATTRRAERFSEIRQLGVEPINYDVLNSAAGSLPQVDAVVYCVGFDRTIGVPIERVYVDGARQTLAAMPAPRRVVYVSSTGVYGDPRGGWVDETTPPAPTDAAGAACLAAERALAQLSKQRGIELVVLRLAGIYGPGRLMNAVGLRAGKPIAANPDAHLNLIHVDDAARVVRLAVEKAPPESLYLVADGQPVMRREFYEEMARQLGAPAPRFDPDAATRHRGDRKVSNAKMIAELGVLLEYPDFKAGIRSVLANSSSTMPRKLDSGQ